MLFGSVDDGIWHGTNGSPAQALTSLAKGERQHSLPQLVANDTVVLFTVRSSVRTWGAESVVAVVLATGERKLLLQERKA